MFLWSFWCPRGGCFDPAIYLLCIYFRGCKDTWIIQCRNNQGSSIFIVIKLIANPSLSRADLLFSDFHKPLFSVAQCWTVIKNLFMIQIITDKFTSHSKKFFFPSVCWVSLPFFCFWRQFMKNCYLSLNTQYNLSASPFHSGFFLLEKFKIYIFFLSFLLVWRLFRFLQPVSPLLYIFVGSCLS